MKPTKTKDGLSDKLFKQFLLYEGKAGVKIVEEIRKQARCEVLDKIEREFHCSDGIGIDINDWQDFRKKCLGEGRARENQKIVVSGLQIPENGESGLGKLRKKSGREK